MIRVAQIMGKWLGGGVESVVMNYYRNIDRTKVQFDFLCDSDSTNIPYEEIKHLGGKVILIPPYQHLINYNKELKNILAKNNYTLVHSHINTLSVFPLKIAKKCGVPVRIAHSHSTTNKLEWKKNLLKMVLRPFSKVYATDYFACSKYAGEWLFGKNTDVTIINNAIDLDKYKYNEKIRKSIRKELKIKDDTLVVGHIGRFVAQKNHTFLIDVFNELNKLNPNSILLLGGQGPLEEEIKEKVKDLNLTDKVIFLGQRTDAERLYQAMDIFLLPSLYEGLGMVLIEAQCAGLHCIASSEIPDVAKVTNLVEFKDLDDAKKWADDILKLDISNSRKGFELDVKKSDYDIKEEAIKLEKKYLEMGDRKWKK